jgi:hypothetical protein
MDDFTLGRRLFAMGKVDVACLWEPDVTLALRAREGSHRIFSTADARELVGDVLLVKRKFLEEKPEVAEKVAKVWFAGVAEAEADKAKAAKFISRVVRRFREELGEEGTLAAFNWIKWANLADNVKFFGIEGDQPLFDRIYIQADGVWTEYPEAAITDRFEPSLLRNGSIIKKLWVTRGH